LIRCNLALRQPSEPEVLLKLLLLWKLLELLLLSIELTWPLLLSGLPSGKYIAELVRVEECVNAVDEGLEECSFPSLRSSYPPLCRRLLLPRI
jgi:hypothetical protein